jgi:hypothetical protein
MVQLFISEDVRMDISGGRSEYFMLKKFINPGPFT